MTTKAAIYCRISRDPQGLRTGVERQEGDGRALAKRKGWTVHEVYVDNDISAWSGKRRPEYERMLEDVEAGKVKAIIAWHLDRLTRSPKELEHFFDVCDAAGVKHFGTVSGDIDLSTRDGQLNARIQGAVAKKASDDASARIRAAFDAKAERGEWKRGGVRPFGYEWDEDAGQLVIRENEAALIREAVERILAGESRRAITRDWHNRGILTSEGKPWSITRLGKLLASPRTIGQRVHRGQVIAEGNWEPILDEATQQRVVRKMRRQGASHRAGRQRHLLTGLAFCGGCGFKLVAKARKDRKGDGFRTYRCSNDSAASCGRCSVVAEPLEQLVLWTAWAAVRPNPIGIFRDALAEAEVDDPQAQRVRDALADLTESERNLTHDHYVERVVSRGAFMEAMAALSDEREALERELTRADASPASFALTFDQAQNVEGPPSTLSDASAEVIEFWRAVVRTVFERVEVKDNWHGRRFQAERVVLRPRAEFPHAADPWPAWDLPAMPDDRVREIALEDLADAAG
jgi:site-specific DNA recombinase